MERDVSLDQYFLEGFSWFEEIDRIEELKGFGGGF
jgi:hypothetical protein